MTKVLILSIFLSICGEISLAETATEDGMLVLSQRDWSSFTTQLLSHCALLKPIRVQDTMTTQQLDLQIHSDESCAFGVFNMFL